MKELDIIYRHSSNYKARTKNIKYIIIHCSALSSDKMIEVFDELKLSVHYIIARDGQIIEMVNPSNEAFHAGKSSWKEDVFLNDCSIGIELETFCLGYDKKDYTTKQINSLLELLDLLVKKYGISPLNILGHSDVSPDRKPDPGIYFPWKKLMKKGFGIRYDLRNTYKEDCEATLLKTIGYNIENIDATRSAFCKHFMADEINFNKKVEEIIEFPYSKNFKIKNVKLYKKILKSIVFRIS